MNPQQTTSTGVPVATVYADRHFETWRRWRWLPWPLRSCWWAEAEINGVGCAVIEDTKDALTDRVIEHVRFIFENDDLSVVVIWKAASSS